jgi:hypothetical protein
MACPHAPWLIRSGLELPAAPYYVEAHDRFMSGWGCAAGKPNHVILPCASVAEALAVERYADQRSDIGATTIWRRKKPPIHGTICYSLYTRETAPAWYPPAGDQGQ